MAQQVLDSKVVTEIVGNKTKQIKYSVRALETTTGHVLTLYRSGKAIVSFPAMLNGFEPPKIDAALAILTGNDLHLEPLTPMTVYRIENKKTGAGMYNSDSEPGLAECPYYNVYERGNKLHPNPWADTKLELQMCGRHLLNYNTFRAQVTGNPLTFESQEWKYAFVNATQARMWLHDDKIINWLDEHNFIVAEITVGPFDALFGNTQAMFKNAPTEYKKHTFKEFFNM